MHKSFPRSDEHSRLVQTLQKAAEDMHREEKYKAIAAAEGMEPEYEEGLGEEQDQLSIGSTSSIKEGGEDDEVDERAEYL
jgi:hypothetical protein